MLTIMQTGQYIYLAVFKPLLLAAVISFVTFSAIAEDLQMMPVNIFGDGDPDNGIEDDRQQLLGGRRRGVSLADQRMNAGTIKCDGKVRGTAMVIDTRKFAPDLKGAVLVSAAHVLYDLDRNKRFKRCEFHFLALSELHNYQARIDLRRVKMGKYDPDQTPESLEFGEGDWVFMYVPKPWKGFNPAEALVPGTFEFTNMESFQQSGGELRLIAFDAEAGVISVSNHCRVIESKHGDLGGGAWKGQLLDDCDSAGGSSGGGIVAVTKGKQYLIGIRNGSHWSQQSYPVDKFPAGPPDGSSWDQSANTNFARAFDRNLLNELKNFSLSLSQDSTLY